MAEATMNMQITPVVGRSVEVKQLAAALSKAQGEVGEIKKDREVEVATKTGGKYTYWYATLPVILAAIRKPMADNGLSLSFDMHNDVKNGDTVIGTLWHSSGEFITATCPIPKFNDMQALGSGKTYARRYIAQDFFNIAADEDDDGQAATEGQQRNRQQNNGGQRQQQNTPPAKPKGDPKVTADQAKAMFDSGTRMGLTPENVRDVMIAFTGVQKSPDLTVPQWKLICDTIAKTEPSELGRIVMEKLAERQLQAAEAAQKNDKMPE